MLLNRRPKLGKKVEKQKKRLGPFSARVVMKLVEAGVGCSLSPGLVIGSGYPFANSELAVRTLC